MTSICPSHNRALPLSHWAARLVQGKHHIPLFENGRLRGINVLAYVFLREPQNAAGKRHAFSVHIVDGKHQPVPEAGVQISPFSAGGRTRKSISTWSGIPSLRAQARNSVSQEPTLPASVSPCPPRIREIQVSWPPPPSENKAGTVEAAAFLWATSNAVRALRRLSSAAS